MSVTLPPMVNQFRRKPETMKLDKPPKSPQKCSNCGNERIIRLWRWVEKYVWNTYCEECTNRIEPGILK